MDVSLRYKGKEYTVGALYLAGTIRVMLLDIDVVSISTPFRCIDLSHNKGEILCRSSISEVKNPQHLIKLGQIKVMRPVPEVGHIYEFSDYPEFNDGDDVHAGCIEYLEAIIDHETPTYVDRDGTPWKYIRAIPKDRVGAFTDEA